MKSPSQNSQQHDGPTTGTVQTKIETAVRPEWGDANAVRARFGICKSTIIRLAEAGSVQAASLRERGKLRGKKLYSLDSIAAYIESMVTSGGHAQ